MRSTSGEEWYAVFRYQAKHPDNAKFWNRVGCTCKASNHTIPICYHKAFVALLLSEGELGPLT